MIEYTLIGENINIFSYYFMLFRGWAHEKKAITYTWKGSSFMLSPFKLDIHVMAIIKEVVL